jgi:hypothetical protein
MYQGQALQDKFVLNVLKNKKAGYFIEIGSNHPITNNNTYLLENEYNWHGVMIEYNNSWEHLYKVHRKNSIHIIDDATKIDYRSLFDNNNIPENIDYLQIDLDVTNNSTIDTLIKLDEEVLDKHKFATITFEHDIFRGKQYEKTRTLSRDIFKKRGYECVFEDIQDKVPNLVYEDWYVHPELVDMKYIEELKIRNRSNYQHNSITEKSLDWRKIIY